METTEQANAELIKIASLIPKEIAEKKLGGPWVNDIKRGWWPEGAGAEAEIQCITYHRVLPEASFITSSPAQTCRTYALKQAQVHSPQLCINSQKKLERLTSIIQSFKACVTASILEHNRDEYTRLAEHKAIAAEALPEGEEEFPSKTYKFLWWKWTRLIKPKWKLTQNVLDFIWMHLVREAGVDSVVDEVNGAPRYRLFTDDTVKENQFRGFKAEVDMTIPRWKIVKNKWVSIPMFKQVAADVGFKSVINPEYVNAPYQDAFIFIQDVFTALHPQPIKGCKGWADEPQDYRGKVKWMNIPTEADSNAEFGFFRCLLMQGSKPIHPELGWVIRHKR